MELYNPFRKEWGTNSENGFSGAKNPHLVSPSSQWYTLVNFECKSQVCILTGNVHLFNVIAF